MSKAKKTVGEAVKNDKKDKNDKKEKDPLAKYIGKKTNEGHKVLAVFPKVIKRENQSPVDMVEVRLVNGEMFIVPEADLPSHLKK